MVSRGEDPGPFASVGKLATSRLVKQVAEAAVELSGPEAVTWPDSVEDGDEIANALLFSPSISLAGGTDQIQRSIVGERLLGLPREPRPDARRGTTRLR
jgi:alkylation response protein AidB-like acyl-CoA dehydrogenase